MTARPRLISLLGLMFLTFGAGDFAYAQIQGDKEPRSETIATINGKRTITRQEIDALVGAQLFNLEERIYNLRKSVLENLITRVLLEEEAQSKGITVEELQKQLLPAKVEIKDTQIQESYDSNIGGLGNMSEDEAKQRIRLDLEAHERIEQYRSALAEIRKKARIVISLPDPIAPTINVSNEGPSKGGPVNSAVTIIEFSDFQCPYCKQAADTLRQVLQAYGDDVRLVFKHLPLPIHPDAFNAAQASVCAAAQGKFWEYHDRLFSSGSLSGDALTAIASELGFNMKDFTACRASESSRAIVSKDVRDARVADVQGTPTLIINGRVMKGARGQEDLKKIIDQEINRSLESQKSRLNKSTQ